MKNSALKIFLRGLRNSFLVIFCLLGVGITSYAITRYYYSKNSNALISDKETIDKIIGEAQLDDIAKNLIYVWDGEKEKVSACVLEIFDTQNNTLKYVTIPSTTEITISTELYQKLSSVESEAPQILKLSKLRSYFDEEKAYDYGVLLLEDYFDIDISYYTAMGKSEFQQKFKGVKKKISFKRKLAEPLPTVSPNYGGEAAEVSDTVTVQAKVKVQQLREEYIAELAEYDTEEKLTAYIQEEYKKLESNMDVIGKIGYVESFLKLDVTQAKFKCIPGEYVGKTFIPELDKCKKMFKKLLSTGNDEDDEITTEDVSNSTEPTASGPDVSVGKSIVILNASQVSGLAAKYKELLTADGFTITQIGNYTDEVLTNTRITVREEGIGTDLLGYFADAEISVGELPYGTDIQVLLGTADRETNINN